MKDIPRMKNLKNKRERGSATEVKIIDLDYLKLETLPKKGNDGIFDHFQNGKKS